ncbi:YegS/Rv2252/BmrU family lipid kinase [Mariniflexile fucanivorans]|uniref:YegS/Rv2252/BmrU family lipid kinase n=1 Tax=Mariniflexile fucanivorans TaxID=264023 RepID=A0A4R1RIW2_9FLAO|nr:YegS/Rv2252/BmrU family lipid kinase [Mariniflexile fucanivorans]TCL66051.1 YegS/Rv2252/BmrU family lipid kinase [Mariniflexile fucanivorans]
MISIHFIVNPIAGTGNHGFSETFLQDYFDESQYKLTVKCSSYKGHAIDLTKESVNQKATIIVACGGDGTINEVASTLVNTNIPLGIIPVGSGNGLASNLKIPQNVKKAIEVIKNNHQTKIDVGCVNEHYFFSNVGFGFSASVIKNYEHLQKRTLYYYIKASIKSYKEFNKKRNIEIEINELESFANPFLIFISNTNELGYHVSLTPKASLQDGLLDVLIVPNLNNAKMLLFGIFMLLKKPKTLKEARCFQTKAIKLQRNQGDYFEAQLDGEFLKIQESSIEISINEQALIIIV